MRHCNLVDDFIGSERRPVHLVREGEDRQFPHAAHLQRRVIKRAGKDSSGENLVLNRVLSSLQGIACEVSQGAGM